MFQQLGTRVLLAAVMAALSGSAIAAVSAVPEDQLIAGTWQNHHVKINYFGITSHYTCSGLENHVKDILVYLGARKDSKVHATGCLGLDRPSPTAWIDADFYTLMPSDASAGSDVIKAYWAPREISTRRPFFMGDGDCELVEQLKDTIAKNFALKDLQYRTDCVPHQINLNGFTVKADALIAVPEPRVASVTR